MSRRLRSKKGPELETNAVKATKKKTGPKKKITSRETTKIKRELKRLRGNDQKVTAHKIKTGCNIDANIRTIQRAMSEMGFGYGKIKKKLPLTKQHKYRRVFLAKQWISENFINQNVIFSDEKRFSFDGPDSWFYWYDPIDPPSRIKRQMNGGGIMVWGMTFPNGEIHVEKL